MASSPPKIAFFDIENAPLLGYSWNTYDTDIVKVIRKSYLLCFSYKWAHEDKVHTVALPDFKGYKKRPYDDRKLTIELWKLMNEADVIVAHNGDAFDLRKSNERMITHGLNPPEPYKTVDTLKQARKHFKFTSNKLDELGKDLQVGRKLAHTGFELWEGCMNGDMRSWALMKRYNKQDVLLLEKVYLRFLPWIQNHPNVALYQDKEGCPNCGGRRVKRGFTYTKTRKLQKLECTKCHNWSSTPINDEEE